MYFGEATINLINNKFDIYYEETFEKVYNFNYNSILNDLNLLEHMSLVKEDGAIAIEGPVQKTNFKEKVMKMIQAVITYIKNIFAAFISTVSKIYEKIRYNTLRDKIVQKIYGNLSYDDLEKAKEKGWIGLRWNYKFLNPDINNEALLTSVKEILKDEDIFKDLEEMKLDKRIDSLKEKEEKIDNTILKIKDKLESRSKLNLQWEILFQKKLDIKAEVEIRRAINEFENKAMNGFTSEEDYNNSKQKLDDTIKRVSSENILPFVHYSNGKRNRNIGFDTYMYPDKEEYNILKDFVLNYKKYLNKIDQTQKPIIADIHKSLANNTSEVIKLTMSKDTSDNDFKQTELIILKTALKVDDIHLKIYKNVTKNFLNACNGMFKIGIKTYSKIVTDIKRFFEDNKESEDNQDSKENETANATA